MLAHFITATLSQKRPRLVIVVTLLLAWSLMGMAEDQKQPLAPPVITEGEGFIGLDRMITLHGKGLKEWQQQNPQKELQVYVGGILIPDAEIILSKLADDWISVILSRDSTKADSRDAWNRVLCPTLQFLGKDWPKVDVTLGRKGELPLITNVKLEMRVIYRGWLWGWFWSMIALAILLFLMGWKTDLLRDDGACLPEGNKPFSLARTQMAFWLFITIAAYLFIFMVTGDTDTVTESVLGLIGISAATGFAAVMVDAAKNTGARLKRDEFTRISKTLNASNNRTPEEQAKLEEANEEIARLNELLQPSASRGFLWDLVSDGGGISFHRFQIAAWTLIVGIIFVHSVYHSLAMPEISATMLGLMGISGGTYIGFKVPEKTN